MYKEGKIAYNGRDFETAKEKLGAVDPEYSGYTTAQECLAEIAGREQAWQTAKFGRNQGTYSLAYDTEFIYIPYRLEGIFGILKADAQSTYSEFIPLSDKKDYIITGMNIIGDYLYFIAGEDVGRGLMFENPYCIYEMKTDGSGLAQVAQGDYFDMIIHDSQVYALSYTKGLVQMDNDFSNETVLVPGDIIEFSAATDGIYYTVRGSLGSKSDNTVYFYDGKDSEEMDSASFLHYYTYTQNSLKLQSSGSKEETLYINDDKIITTDILKVYGLLGGKVIYSTPGNDAQERLNSYDINSKDTQSYTGSKELPEYYIKGISYETEQIYLVNSDGAYVTGKGFEDIHTLELPAIDNEKLTTNMALLRHIEDAELYSPEEPEIVVLSDELLWYYSDAKSQCRYGEEISGGNRVCCIHYPHSYKRHTACMTTQSWGSTRGFQSLLLNLKSWQKNTV